MNLDLLFEQNQQNINVPFAESGGKFNADFGEVSVIHDGRNGATFTPNVSEDGILSWTNDRELPNPEPVNIKGKDGKDGKDGADGRTPVKGTDYFTEEDVQEIVDKVAEEMPTPVTSWNDLTDKPFGVNGTSWTLVGSGTGASSPVNVSFTAEEGKTYKIEVIDGLVNSVLASNTAPCILKTSMGLPYYWIGERTNEVYGYGIINQPLKFYTTVTGLGGIKINVYEAQEAIQTLNKKFLPDDLVFNNELNNALSDAYNAVLGLGYQTEEQVTALINNALGVIENGTY